MIFNLKRVIKCDSSDIVFLGDSLTSMGEWEKLIPKKIVFVLGCGGDSLEGICQRASLVKNLNPKTIIVFGGVNNLNRLFWKKKFKIFYTQLINSILETTKTICLFSLPPTRKPCKISNAKIIAANNMISDIAKINNVYFFDTYSLLLNNGTLNLAFDNGDGMHLNKEAYALISRELKKKLGY